MGLTIGWIGGIEWIGGLEELGRLDGLDGLGGLDGLDGLEDLDALEDGGCIEGLDEWDGLKGRKIGCIKIKCKQTTEFDYNLLSENEEREKKIDEKIREMREKRDLTIAYPIQYNTIQNNVMSYNTKQCIIMQYDTQYNKMQKR